MKPRMSLQPLINFLVLIVIVRCKVNIKILGSLHVYPLEHLEDGTTVYTDEHRGYNPIAVEYDRKSVKHSLGEHVNDQIYTNGMESFWSMLKRGYIGTYHRLSEKHLQRYADEFAGRHNKRPLATMEQIGRTVDGMAGKRLKYKELTG